MTVNTAPTLDGTANPSLPAILENASNPSGITIGALVAGSITDPDGVVNAIAVTGLDTSLGAWQYSTDGGATWLTISADLINSATDELALLLAATDQIRLLPFGELNGSLAAAVTFRAWDGTSGSHGDYVEIASTGGSTAFSSASDTASVSVAAVNDGPTFAPPSGTGEVMVPIGSTDDYAQSVTMQPDGKILVAGHTVVSGHDQFSLSRLNADGTLDTGFNGTGKLTLAIGSNDEAYGVTLQADGKIVVAGQSYNGSNYDFALVRLNADGTLDTGFNGSGKLTLPFGGSDDSAYSVSVQADGRIIVAGQTYDGSHFDSALARVNADGTLDTGFNGTGKLTLPVSTSDDYAYSTTVQADGKILVAGASFNGSKFDFALSRLNADGTLDTGFNSTGKLTLPIGSIGDLAQSVTVQPDGKIVLAGYSVNGSGNYDFALARVNADGTLDTAFNGTGTLTLAFGSANDQAHSVVLQPDGKIIVAGLANTGSDLDFALSRVNADGTLDTSFNGTGKLTVPVGDGNDGGYSVTLQPDGKIVVAGIGSSGAFADFGIIRVNPDGSLDDSFNAANANTLGGTIAYTEDAAPVALDGAVSIYDPELSAADDYSGASVTLARHAGASSDDVFSAMGNLALSGGNAVLSGVTVGTYTNAGGTLSITFNGNATQAAVNEALSSIGYANGSDAPPASVQIDWSFSDGNAGAQGTGGAATATGSTTVTITPTNDAPVLDAAASPSLAATTEGAANPAGTTVSALLAGGSDPDGDTVGIAVTALDTSLGAWQYSADGGTTWITIRADLIDGTADELALLLGATDKIRLLPFGELNGSLPAAVTFRAWDGTSGSHGDYVVVAATGGTSAFSTASDTAGAEVAAVNHAPTFAPPVGTGKLTLQIGGSDWVQGVTIQPDGKIVLAGNSFNSGYDMGLVRLNPDGTLDTSFNGSGELTVPIGASSDYGQSVALQSNGKIVVAGYTWNGSDDDFAVSRVNADGTLDTSFNGTGKLALPIGGGNDEGYGVAVQADGKIVVAGYSANGVNDDFALSRLNADGTLDTSFNGTGKLTLPIGGGNDEGYSVAIQADGKIVVAGETFNGSSFDFALCRVNADGTPDTGFNGTGTLSLSIGGANDGAWSVMVQADGKIVVAGETYNGSNWDFALARVNADGTPDTGFNGTGQLIVPVGGSNDEGYSVTAQPDGKIILAGKSYNGSDWDFALARVNVDGTLDTSFNGTGKLTLPIGASDDIAYSVAVEPDGKIVVAGYTYGSHPDLAIVRLNPDGSLDAGFNVTNTDTLGGAIAYTENAAPVALDASVSVYDPELSAADDYSGASVTLARHGGASADDLLSALGNLALSGGNAVLSGVTIGTYTNAGGTLSITFNGNATQASVNETLSSIGYANASDNPDASVQVDWTFGDGNSSAQGAGGALTGTGSTTVNITAVNDAPVAVADTASATEAGTAAGTDPTGNVLTNDTDVDSGDSKSVIAISGGTVGTPLAGSYGTLTLNADGGFTYVVDNNNGTVNALDAAGTLQDAFSYTMHDTAGATSSATLTVTIHGQNDAPTGSVAVNGAPDAGQTLTAVPSISDPEGIASALGYQWSVGGFSVAGATGSSYLVTAADVGKAISVVVSYTDGGGTHESTTGTASALVNQVVNGTSGNDHLIGGTGDDQINGGLGADTMEGGLGNDTYYVNTAHDVVIEQAGAGIDTILVGIAYVLPLNVENLTLTGVASSTIKGNALDNVMIGNSGNNLIYGYGGADTLTGGLGADKFMYAAKSDSPAGAADTITDFSHAQLDVINLRSIDANDDVPRNQAFVFIGTQAFSDFPNAAGLLRFDTVTHMLEGSTNTDASPEFQILLTGVTGVGTGANQVSAADILL
jgi:uncharacterized delta-60 repeat protein